MKKKLFCSFFFIILKLISIKNEVLSHEANYDINNNETYKNLVNETYSNSMNVKHIGSINDTSNNSTFNKFEENSDKFMNQMLNNTLNESSIIENNSLVTVDNNIIEINNSSEIFKEIVSNETSSRNESYYYSTTILNEIDDSNNSSLKEKIDLNRNLKDTILNENEQIVKTNPDNIEDYKIKKDFNLTEEIEKLYYDRQIDNSTNLEDSYIDHDSDYYENIEEVQSEKEEQYRLRLEREEEDRLKEEWQKKVSDFTAQDLLTIKLKKYSTYKFYEDVQKVPSKIKVAFFVNDEYKKLNFEILEPSGKTIFVDKNKAQSFFEFTAEKRGIYKFILTNHDSISSIKVSFAFHSGENVDSHLKSSHLDEFTKHLKYVDQKIKELKFSQNILNKKYDGHQETTLVHNYRIQLYSIIETILMSVIFVVQIFYIKNLIKDY